MSDTMDTSDLLQGVREIARFLNVKERTAEYWIEQKRIPVKRIGRTIVARRSKLLAAFDDDQGDD
jgi:excisionase family DNA binding protein